MAEAQSLGLTIIYSDTDSLFVINEHSKVEQLLAWVRKTLELEIRVDREYRRILFTEATKRYAGLLPDGRLDIVGFEAIRHDWTEVARRVQEQVLRSILEDQSTERAEEAVRIAIEQIRNGELPVSELAIHKTLTKPLEKYTVRAPHVEVARKLLSEGQTVAVGEKVSYVIVNGPGALFQKARPFHEAKSKDIDAEYYIENQIKPAAMRILESLGPSNVMVEC